MIEFNIELAAPSAEAISREQRLLNAEIQTLSRNKRVAKVSYLIAGVTLVTAMIVSDAALQWVPWMAMPFVYFAVVVTAYLAFAFSDAGNFGFGYGGSFIASGGVAAGTFAAAALFAAVFFGGTAAFVDAGEIRVGAIGAVVVYVVFCLSVSVVVFHWHRLATQFGTLELRLDALLSANKEKCYGN